MRHNPLLLTDSYKLSHAELYAPGISEVYSYMEARKQGEPVVFYGLQYYLIEYLSREIETRHVENFLEVYDSMFGQHTKETEDRFYNLAKLGHWPVEIKALPEGSIVSGGNALITIKNTHPDFAWCVGYLESLLLKVWNTCTVASCSLKYWNLVKKYADLTCDNDNHLPFSVHDFGYRGVSSEETAALSGSAHLLLFRGSDTVPAINFLMDYYDADGLIGTSVIASEHSVMCSYGGPDHEFEALDTILFDRHPTGIVSVVSDTYNFWRIMTEYVQSRKERIIARDGRVVFRPDSSPKTPVEIVCGDYDAEGLPARLGALNLLWDCFGGYINKKGYRVLDSHVGLIYGDGMFYERFQEMLSCMADIGFASENLVIGVGGLLLQQHSRDDLKFAFKATRVIKDGKPLEIYKDPITDPGKRSKKGLMTVKRSGNSYVTFDRVCESHESEGELKTVFVNGLVTRYWSLQQIRNNIKQHLQ